MPEAAKSKLREVAGSLYPLKLLEEIRAVQAHLMALADGDKSPALAPEHPAWRAGEARPTFNIEAKPRYLRSASRDAGAYSCRSPGHSLASEPCARKI